MKFLSDILAKAGLTVDGVVTLNNTATGQTPDANDNSTKLATTAWVRTFVQPYSLPIASASVLGGVKVGSGLSINSSTGVLSVVGASVASIKSTQTFVVTEGQTVFTVTGGYTPGLIDIFLNGVYLSPNQTVATNGTTFTINDPAAAGDIVDVIVASAIFEGSASTTDQLPEGSINLYYTNTRARAAITLTTTSVSGAATYNSSTGVFNIPNYQGLVPAGGVAGDILAKVSGTNYDVTWIPNYTSTVQHTVKAAVAVTKGQAVYVSSADGTNMIVSKASNASEGTSSKTLGLVAQDLAINGQGFVVTEGLLAGLNTSTAQTGDPVWLGTNGNLIFGLLNKPTAPAHLVFIGIVTRVQSNNGEIFVKVQNGFELDELHDLSVKNPTDGDMIKYVASTGLWTKIAATTTNITEGTNLYYTQARFDTAFAAKSTTNLSEGTNLYYTNARARAAISVTGSGSYDSATGIITVTGGVTSVNTLTGAVTLTTTNIGEGTNLYYTTARVNSDFDTRLATKSTTNLAEGTNLYYTDARVGTYLTNNSYATQSYVSTQINNLVSGAPGLLDTLDELAAALGDDPNFATTVSTALSNRLRIDINNQGLTSTQQGNGRTNLGLGSLAILSSVGNAQITDVAYSKLTGVPSTFTPSSHTHPISDITGLQTALDGKQASLSGTGFVKISGSTISYDNSTYYLASNPSGYITGITSLMVTNALGYTPYNAGGNTVLTNINYTSYALRWNSTQAPANGLDNTSIVPNSVTLFDGYGAPIPGYPSGAAQWWVGALTIGDANRGFQIAGGYADSDIYFRKGNSTWSTWRKVWTDANLTNLNQLTNGPGYITGYTETDTLASVTARGATTSTNVTLSGTANQFSGHHYFLPWDSDGNHYPHYNIGSNNNGSKLNLRMFGGNGSIVRLFFLNGNTGAISWDGNTIWHAGNLTNLNQLANGPGYITGYTETDTLASVTGRGATTATAISINNELTITNGRVTVRTGGVNSYGVVSGYENNNHMMTFRAAVTGSTSSPTFTASHQMTFVEFAQAGDSTGWYFKSASSGTYEEIARITRTGINWNGNTVIHSGNIGSYTAGAASSVAWGNVTSKPGDIMYYAGFTLDADTMPSNSTGFTYSVNAPLTGPIVKFSTGGGYDLQINAPYYWGNEMYFRVRNGDLGVWRGWKQLLNAETHVIASRMNQDVRTTDNVTFNAVTISANLNLPNNALIVVNGESNTWGARFRTNASTTNLGGQLKNIIFCGGGVAEGFAVTGVGTGSTAFEVTNGGNAFIKDSLYVNGANSRIQAGTTSVDGMLYDSSGRPALVARAAYPHIELWADVSNGNHGGTLRFGGYDNGSSGAYKNWNIGTPGSDLYFMDIGYGGTSNSNPHAGIAGLGAAYGYPNAFTIMRFHNNGNVGIGNFGTYGSEGNTPNFKLDVRGTGRFTGALSANTSLTVGGGGDALAIAGAEGRITFRDQALLWTGYVGFRGNLGVVEFPGRNVQVSCGYNGNVEINTGTNDYLSGRLTVPFGSVNARRGFTSESNPWGTADSSFHPNGITTGGSTNWIYGLTYLGNAPSNGSGAEVASNGRSYFRSSNTSGVWGYAGQFVDRNSAANNYVPWSFENEWGNHSWGIVARFHIQTAGQDKPAIQFTSAGSNERWSLGYCSGTDFQFRITQNQGFRTDGSGNSDGWGTERFRIDTGGTLWSNGVLNLGPDSGADNGLSIRYGSGSYGRIRFHQDGTNHSTIHSFGSGWQSNNIGSSGGCININGQTGVTFGPWNVPAGWVNNSGTAWFREDVTAFSDARVKNNVELVNNAVEKIKSIRGVTFTRNDVDDKDKRHAGVIAQEVLEVLPEVVSKNEENMYSVAYGNMAALFIEAIKEQQAQIESQKSEIEELKDLVKQLINR